MFQTPVLYLFKILAPPLSLAPVGVTSMVQTLPSSAQPPPDSTWLQALASNLRCPGTNAWNLPSTHTTATQTCRGINAWRPPLASAGQSSQIRTSSLCPLGGKFWSLSERSLEVPALSVGFPPLFDFRSGTAKERLLQKPCCGVCFLGNTGSSTDSNQVPVYHWLNTFRITNEKKMFMMTMFKTDSDSVWSNNSSSTYPSLRYNITVLFSSVEFGN